MVLDSVSMLTALHTVTILENVFLCVMLISVLSIVANFLLQIWLVLKFRMMWTGVVAFTQVKTFPPHLLEQKVL